ncbi:MAG: NnrU family protein [Gammaproteobacteria bacterium]|nr:MAG: NnrU family protein [Gammaproteobacteria bacterium]
MTLLIAGLAVFFGPHLISTFVPLRAALVDRLGENPYMGLYSAVSLAGLVMIVMGYARAPLEVVYEPPTWGRSGNTLLMLVAVILLVAAYAPSNIKRLTAHPMLWGTFLWAAGHLLANGDKASLLLFGSFAIYALYDMWSANRRGQRPSKEKYPFAKDITIVVLALIIYAILFRFHGTFFGAPLI